jgi:hypothetical protein
MSVNVITSMARTITRTRKGADALWKNFNQLVGDTSDRMRATTTANRSIEEFQQLSGQGNSRAWRFNRSEIHQR